MTLNRSHPYPSWSPKTLRERLAATRAPDPATHTAIQHLIGLLDLHRPLDNSGKHGLLHTPTCGCEDTQTGGWIAS